MTNFIEIMDQLLKFNYNNSRDSQVLTTPLATLYKNVGESNIAYVNMSSFIFVPLFSNDIDSDVYKDTTDEDIIEMKNMKETFGSYIDFIYEHYKETAEIVSQANKELNKDK